MKEQAAECKLLESNFLQQQQQASCVSLDSIVKSSCQGDVLQKIGNLQALIEVATQSGRPEEVCGMSKLLDQLLDVVRGILLAQGQKQFPSPGIWPSPCNSTNDVVHPERIKVEDWLDIHFMAAAAAAAESKSNNHVEDELIELEASEILAEHTHFCHICGKGFKRDANLRMHMRGHGEEFKSPSALSKPTSELPTGYPPRRRRYSCPFLGCKRNREHKRFVPLKTMLCVKNHYKRSHCPKRLVCSRCGVKKFAVLADLKTHEKHCGIERWRCSCGTTFSRKDKLLGHVALFLGHSPVVTNSSPTPIIVMPHSSAPSTSSSSLVSFYSNPDARQSSSLQQGDSYQLQQQNRVLQQLESQGLDRHQVALESPRQQQDVLSSDSSASGNNDNEDDHNSSTNIYNGWLFDDQHQDNNKMLNDLEFLGLDFFIS